MIHDSCVSKERKSFCFHGNSKRTRNDNFPFGNFHPACVCVYSNKFHNSLKSEKAVKVKVWSNEYKHLLNEKKEGVQVSFVIYRLFVSIESYWVRNGDFLTFSAFEIAHKAKTSSKKTARWEFFQITPCFYEWNSISLCSKETSRFTFENEKQTNLLHVQKEKQFLIDHLIIQLAKLLK